MLSSTSTENPQSSRTEARKRAHSPSPGESGARVGFLESIFIRARASETASPRGIATDYLLLAVLPDAFGLDFVAAFARSEEHTSELQSQSNLVCRLLLEKRK